MKVKTASNGRPYVLQKDGRAKFVTTAAAKKAGWEAPKAKKGKGKR